MPNYGNILFVAKTPACRNGRRGRLKICCWQQRMGSSPIAGIIKSLCITHKLFCCLNILYLPVYRLNTVTLQKFIGLFKVSAAKETVVS